MPPKNPRLAVDEKGSRPRSRSRSRSPGRRAKKAATEAAPTVTPVTPAYPKAPVKNGVSAKEGKVKENDILMLPSSDFQLLGVLTIVAICVRLFRIYQPSSVVFDEVQ